MKSLQVSIYSLIITLIATIAGVQSASAFPTSTYASQSKLSSGRWVKISVGDTGMYLITSAQLRSWGFSDPAKVRVYGYGGRRISDVLSLDTYVDDLPMVQSALTSKGIVFYAVGVTTPLTANDAGNYSLSSNPYSTKAYYFLSDIEAPQPEFEESVTAAAPALPATTFTEAIVHERDLFSPAQSGHLLLGEDFRFQQTQNFPFTLTDREPDSEAWMQCDFFAKSLTNPVGLSFRVDSAPLPTVGSDRVAASKEFGDTCRIQKTFTPKSDKITLSIQAELSGTVSIAALDRLTVNYTRRLRLPASGALCFSHAASSLKLADVNSVTRVWDVTNPHNIISIKPIVEANGSLAWNKTAGNANSKRTYAVWSEAATFPSPTFAGNVRNQNIHSVPTPDMVIITHPDLHSYSRRIADIHSRTPQPVSSLILTPEEIYNEFSSGTPDVNAFRRMLKMFYDRPDTNIKYVLLMGGVTFDHRQLTRSGKSASAATLPIWQSDHSRSESSSYCTDDIITFLADNSGRNSGGNDLMSIAVGRIPATNGSQAKVYVDRLEKYLLSPQPGQWRNRIVLLADDEDNGIHMSQTEAFEQNMRNSASGRNFTYHKVYVDAFEKQAGVVTVARNKLHNLLNDGVVWWNYVGHASTTTLSGEGVLTLPDLSSLYLRKAPFFYGATCSFSHWDGASISGLEQLILSEAGGLIGGISAVRPVYITRNGVLTEALGARILARNADGRFNTVAEALRLAKNDIGADSNKLRYVLMGDPAVPLASPANIVTLDSVNSIAIQPESQPTLEALAHATLSGSVVDPQGRVMTGFNGWIDLSLFDAEQSITTLGRGDEGAPITYDEQGDRLFTGRAAVTEGRWTLSFTLPGEIADNYRPATLAMYAETADRTESAAGVDRSCYVYGYSTAGLTDSIAPVIDELYVNHSSFRPGDTVNPAPMLIAKVSDNVGINLSNAGVGHQLSLRIDGTDNFTDLSASYTPDAQVPGAGSIFYQLPELTPGHHTATLRVWDVNANCTEREVTFFVDPQAAPKIFDIYTDANPATTQANFYISHNRPDAMLGVTVEVFAPDGRKVWSNTVRGRADMFTATPVTWNLTTSTGAPVTQGIYIYRATVETEATPSTPSTIATASRRLAVIPE